MISRQMDNDEDKQTGKCMLSRQMDNDEDKQTEFPFNDNTMTASGRLLNNGTETDTMELADVEGPMGHTDCDVYITLRRKLYTQDRLDKEYGDGTVTPSFKEMIRNKSACSCKLSRILEYIASCLPIIGVINNYAWKRNAPSDAISGLSVSLMHIPQGIATGLMTSLPAVHGIYTSFFPILIYLIFGTCQHVSMGCNAVLSLLTANIVERELDLYKATHIVMDHSTNSPLSSISLDGHDGTSTRGPALEGIATMSMEEQYAYKVGVASSVAFISGAFLLGMGLLKLGFISTYLSISFVGGFTTAVSFHIATSQIPTMLHISVPPQTGAGKLIKTYMEIFENIHNSNLPDVIVSLISFAFLLGVTIFVNERYSDKMRLPIPVDIIIVIISTIISHFADLEQSYGVAIVGDIPLGLPSPAMPNTEVMTRLVGDSFVLAILVFSLTISLTKLMADMHSYKINTNQELVAIGLCNFLSSFFQCFPSGGGLARTMTLSNIGVKSTLNGLVIAMFILLVLLVAGQLFVSLPVAVLSVMICVAVKNLLLQVQQLPYLWRVSKPDFSIWVITCTASIFIDLDIGIAAGVGVSILTVIARNQLVTGTIGHLSSKEDLVVFGNDREGINKNDQFKIFYFPSQLFYANVEMFSNELFSKILNPLHLNPVIHVQNNGDDNTFENGNLTSELTNDEKTDNDIKYVILECSAISYIDIAGANVLKRIASQYQKVGVTLILASCPRYTLDLLERAGYFEIIDRNTTFCNVYDAISYIRHVLQCSV